MKKFFAAAVSAVMLICLAGCSGKYVMTEEDLAVQKSIEGFWYADDSTGYNEYDDYGNCTALTVVEFTNDYNYLLHTILPGDGQADGYVMTNTPIKYTFEDKTFKVDVDGVASYAKVTVSEDGGKMFWITDERTDTYNRLTEEQAVSMGITPYTPEAWTETEPVSESVPESAEGSDNSDSSETTPSETESETGTVSENTEEGAAVINPNADVSDDIDVSKFNFDRSVTLASESADIDSDPVLLWDSEDGMTAIYGIYLYGKEPYIFIEHDGVIDTFEQDWLTPRRIEPIFKFDDFDSDGADELAASYYVGSGTGVSVMQLVIYEKGEDGHYTDHKFEEPEKQANKYLEISVDNDSKIAVYTLNGETYSNSFGNDIVTGYYADGLTAEDIAFGALISFGFSESGIVFRGTPGCLTVYGGPAVFADVEYSDGKFTLTNFEFAEEE